MTYTKKPTQAGMARKTEIAPHGTRRSCLISYMAQRTKSPSQTITNRSAVTKGLELTRSRLTRSMADESYSERGVSSSGLLEVEGYYFEAGKDEVAKCDEMRHGS
jgi:hypothetical protein